MREKLLRREFTKNSRKSVKMAMAGETLDFSVCQEVRGAMHDGRLRLSSQNFIFKDTITGRSDTISPDDVTDIYWRRVARGWQLKLRLENGKVKKFDGLKEEHKSKIGDFMQSQIGKEMEVQEMSLKGWNWGKAEVMGDELQFTLDDGKPSFDIPLGNVSNCVQNKNEVTLEFHQNDATNQITMMECRFHMPFGKIFYVTRFIGKNSFYEIFILLVISFAELIFFFS